MYTLQAILLLTHRFNTSFSTSYLLNVLWSTWEIVHKWEKVSYYFICFYCITMSFTAAKNLFSFRILQRLHTFPGTKLKFSGQFFKTHSNCLLQNAFIYAFKMHLYMQLTKQLLDHMKCIQKCNISTKYWNYCELELRYL